MNSYRPTEQMAAAARRGLKMRAQQPRSRQGGTAIGLARARQFAERRAVSIDIVRRTLNFLTRARVYYKPGTDSPGTQAYLLWGGPAGIAWARNILKQEQKNGKAN